MNATLPRTAANVAAITAALLLIPTIAMLFTGEVNWGPGDFIAAAALLFTAGMAYTVGSRKVANTKQRVLVALAVLLVLATVWAELAVGLFD